MSRSILEKNRACSNVSSQKRVNILLFFLYFVPGIWYLVLSINISPPCTNSNTFAIGMIGLRMSTTTLQHIYGFGSLVHDSCFLGPLMNKTPLIIQALTEAEISILSVEKGIQKKGLVKLSVYIILLSTLILYSAYSRGIILHLYEPWTHIAKLKQNKTLACPQLLDMHYTQEIWILWHKDCFKSIPYETHHLWPPLPKTKIYFQKYVGYKKKRVVTFL